MKECELKSRWRSYLVLHWSTMSFRDPGGPPNRKQQHGNDEYYLDYTRGTTNIYLTIALEHTQCEGGKKSHRKALIKNLWKGCTYIWAS